MTIPEIINELLLQRGLVSPSDQAEFFAPIHPSNLPSPFDSTSAIALINHHIEAGHPIAIYGDYDVDGVCATAILWEFLYPKTNEVFPFIPKRHTDGYGLSLSGIDACLEKGAKLIICVDNGITAHTAVSYARDGGCDVIIIDHHEPAETLPDANVILHSTSTCAAALVWFFTRDFGSAQLDDHLALAGMAVVCDMMPLIKINRSFATHGIKSLRKTKRLGLNALLTLASVDQSQLSAYHLGFVIGPRINATGRLDHALDSLRLLCTTSPTKASELAQKLTELNTDRQQQTSTAVLSAIANCSDPLPSIIVSASTDYNEGIVGLVASKLVEKYHRPAIAIAISDELCKGSARSVSGVHITELLRNHSSLLKSVGGHAMAAGLSLLPENLPTLITSLQQVQLDESLLIKKQRVDLALISSAINRELYDALQSFEPFGLGNPTPIFSLSQPELGGIRPIGRSQEHLKFVATGFDAVWFHPDDTQKELLPQASELYFQLSLNDYNGRQTLQLLVKGLKSENGSPPQTTT